MPMIVKICGITGISDAIMALNAGADWIGLNLVGGPRQIELAAVREIVDAIAEPARAVVLLRLAARGVDDGVLDALRSSGVRRLQLYGTVTPRSLAELSERGFETILVQRIGDKRSLDDTDALFKGCTGQLPTNVLIDSAVLDKEGGTGQTADWNLLETLRNQDRFRDWPPLILAGGLHAANVGEAINRIRPFGVDVSSGVESTPGRKDQRKVQAFVEAVRAAAKRADDPLR